MKERVPTLFIARLAVFALLALLAALGRTPPMENRAAIVTRSQ